MSRPSGRAWAYAAAGLGAVVSVAANVGHSYVPPAGSGGSWRPPAGAVALAAFWPCALLLAVEVLARVPWPEGQRWAVLRWGGLVPVATVAAVVSYRHLSGLLAWYGEDVVTVALGPLAVDGLMVVATGALLATSSARRVVVPVVVPVVAPAAATPQDRPVAVPGVPAGPAGPEAPAGPRERPAAPPARPRAPKASPAPVDVEALLPVGRAVAAELAGEGRPLTRDGLLAGMRARGHGLSATRGGELLRALRAA